MLPIPSAITGKAGEFSSLLTSGLGKKLPQQLLKVAPRLIAKANHLPLNIRSGAIKAIPKVITPAFALLPFGAQQKLLLPVLTSVFKEALEDGDFEFLQDKWLRISITDLNINWWLSYDQDQLIMAPAKTFSTAGIPSSFPLQQKEDVSFSGSGDDLLLIAGRKQDPDTLFFQRRLKIEGDTELGLELKNLIDAIDLDHLPGEVHNLVAASAELLQQTKSDLAAKNS
ncbi:ubiquinone anaerobic biosynthesis accessory factor UbiT [Thalassomonas actiniarum]|uniref:Ubiquinone biosynthesis accessory factor UbiT n=1 Tax=Thalassomonas actiniarum TaxID=485447 RepID=A0AAE9YWN3_9GAMM|nr:SCP2 sterol-binding domain-containing protein [Thalassomonas actiniarum]WDE00932.1 SCP2 sterol-binding domain-containing protein [Thalassomonas actiniarum]